MKHLLLLALVVMGCVESTGGRPVAFQAVARGNPEVVTTGSLTFTSGRGFEVTLNRAQLTVGALYLNQQNPQNYTLEQSCIQDGVYSGEVRGGLTINALSAEPQPFPVEGNGTDALTRSAELWLTGGDLFADTDRTPILQVEGVATSAAGTFPFSGTVTIGGNRAVPPRNPALPGSNPLCRQRIVSPIAFETTLAPGSTVELWVDPRAWFAAVDFAALTPAANGTFVFVDDVASTAEPDKALYNGLRSAAGPYQLTVTP